MNFRIARHLSTIGGTRALLALTLAPTKFCCRREAIPSSVPKSSAARL
jgi:hypothetical protein